MSDPWGAFPLAPQGSGTQAPPQQALSPPTADPWAAFPVAEQHQAETPGVRFREPPQGTPGQYGLIWNQDGGYDPKTGELVIGGKQLPEKEPSQGLAAASSFLSGVPIVGPALFNGALKTGAYLREKIYGDPADQTESAVRNEVERSQAAYPKTSTGAGIGGAVVGMAPAVEMAPAAFGVGPGGVTAGKLVAGGLSGGAIGAADAAVRSNGDPDAVLRGVGAGAAGGAAGPVVGAGLSRLATGAAGLLARPFTPDVGMSRPAATALMRTLEADNALGPDGLARIRSAGPGGMLADVGPATAGALDTAMQRGGPGSTAARQAIEQRAADSNRELTTQLDRTFGPEQGVHTAETAIRTGSQPARNAAYNRAYGSPIDYSSAPGRAIEALVTNHVPASAIQEANALIRADHTAGPSRQILARVGDDGRVVFEQMPDVRQLDFITRGLNEVAAHENGKGALGGTTQLGNAYGNLSKAIRAQLRKAVPAYGDALETAAEPIAARNALQFGSELLRTNVPRDVAVETISHMTGPELASARGGLRAYLGEKLANVRRTIADGNIDARQAQALLGDLSSDAARQKITLLAEPHEARRMLAALDREAQALTLRAATASNSRTFGRAATNSAVGEAMAPGIVGKALEGKPVQAPQSILQAMFARRPQDYARREDAVFGELANALTGPRGPAAEGILERMIRMDNVSGRANSIAGAIPYGALSQTSLMALLPSFNQRPQHP